MNFLLFHESSDGVGVAVEGAENITSDVEEILKLRSDIHAHVKFNVEFCKCAEAGIRILLQNDRVAFENKA